MWRNWQTRRFQVPVGNRVGSNPFIRTTQAHPFQGCAFCVVRMKVLRVTQITVGSREARPNTEIKNKGEAYRRDDAFWKMIAFSLALAP